MGWWISVFVIGAAAGGFMHFLGHGVTSPAYWVGVLGVTAAALVGYAGGKSR